MAEPLTAPTDTEILDWMEAQIRVSSEDREIVAIQFNGAAGYHDRMTLRECMALLMGHIPHPGWPDVPGRAQWDTTDPYPEASDDPS